MKTFFAPPGRDTAEELAEKQAVLLGSPLVQGMMEAMPLPVIVLNDKRQVVAANRAALALLGQTAAEVLGKRPGEMIGCTHQSDGPDGCGTGPHCATCGAVAAILESQNQAGASSRDWRVMGEGAQAMDFRVTASVLDVGSERFTVCALEDISHRKRLSVLTRLFFHDVLNTAGCIQGCAYLLARRVGHEGEAKNWCQKLNDLVRQLVDDIESQRDLTNAETGDLAVRPEPVETVAVLESLRQVLAAHPAAEGRHIMLGEVWQGSLVTDARILARVLGNMIKNALEATEPGGTVTLSCAQTPRAENAGQVVFRVHNSSVMPEEVQLQVFHRSFSTKGQPGHGIGTYSMKLLGERYLGGRVRFTSRAPEGTTFNLTLPMVLPAPQRR